MTLPEVVETFGYWRLNPPVHELLALLARCFTTWKPEAVAERNDEVAHRASLERRWKSGAMNAKQIFDALGGQPMTMQ